MDKQRDVVRECAKHLCVSLDTPRSMAVFMLLDAHEDLQVATLGINALDYDESDLQKFRDDYLVTEYLSKYTGLDTKLDLEEVALSSFREGEAICARSNRRLTENDPNWVRFEAAITAAQRFIHSAVGSRPKWAKLQDRFRWGKGATSSLKGRDVRIDKKLREERISVTQEALPYLRAAMATDYAWLNARGVAASGPTTLLHKEFNIVEGNRVVLVDKNAKTKRTIAAEPTGNIFLQLGVGSFFRQCLLRVGIDLTSQQTNQVLAGAALDLGLATVDLKNASNTICRELVWLLFPEPWAQMLDDLRSPQSLMPDGQFLKLEMFSSMGNGFTFEMETLIFWALCRGVAEVSGEGGALVSVYGDDIILPASLVDEVRELFSFVGFTLNEKKTHYDSLFRESCGKHFFNGSDVTPIYQKRPEDDDSADDDAGRNTYGGTAPSRDIVTGSYRLYNRLFYHSADRGWVLDGVLLCDRRFLPALREARKHLETLVGTDLIRIPALSKDRVMDGGMVDSPERVVIQGSSLHKTNRAYYGLRYWAVTIWAFKPKRVPAAEIALFAYALRYKPDTPFDGCVTLRRAGKWQKTRRFFREMCNILWI